MTTSEPVEYLRVVECSTTSVACGLSESGGVYDHLCSLWSI